MGGESEARYNTALLQGGVISQHIVSPPPQSTTHNKKDSCTEMNAPHRKKTLIARCFIPRDRAAVHRGEPLRCFQSLWETNAVGVSDRIGAMPTDVRTLVHQNHRKSCYLRTPPLPLYHLHKRAQ